ncbi:MAG: hypothetical protein AB8I08_24090 [Sandaracinaceae bacterium]
MKRAAILLSLLATSCVTPRDGRFLCPDDGPCPAGMICASDAVCRVAEVDAGDGSVLDSGIDAGLIDGGPLDGGPLDGGPIDGGPVDGGPDSGFECIDDDTDSFCANDPTPARRDCNDANTAISPAAVR